ncbi:F-BAR domain-containing protein [Balamuthia mandrillaris]
MCNKTNRTKKQFNKEKKRRKKKKKRKKLEKSLEVCASRTDGHPSQTKTLEKRHKTIGERRVTTHPAKKQKGTCGENNSGVAVSNGTRETKGSQCKLPVQALCAASP